MRKSVVPIVIALGSVASVGHAQSFLDQVSSAHVGNEGAGLYEVSVFSGYSTSPYPVGVGQVIPQGASQLGPDENYGANFIVGWQRHRLRGGFSVRYTGTYNGLVHYSGANGYSQSLSLSADRQLSPKWTVRIGIGGQDSTLIEFLDAPSPTSVVSQIPTDFDDFAAAFGLGSFSTSQAASAILGAPVVQAPLAALLLGDKVLTYSGTAGITYAFSRHLSFQASTFASGGQDRSNAQTEIPQTNYVLPLSFGENAGITWSYSLTPRTQVGVSVMADRMEDHFQTSEGETATASLGRKMGMHWFLRAYGGATLTQISQQLYGTPRTRQAVGGGTIGIKTYTETLTASYDRSASDSYGITGTYTTLAGSWSWHHPGSRYSLFANISQQQMRDTGFESLSGWQAGGGLSERLTSSSGLRAQYVYFHSGGNYLGSATTLSVQSVRLSMSWSPEAAQR